jgi:hypothetical protein
MKRVNEQYNLRSRRANNKKTLSTQSVISSPSSLSAASGDTAGEIDLAWEPVIEAHTYVVQKSKGSKHPLKWTNEDIVTKSNCTITKLKSRHKYWFRVAAVGRSGQGPWSEFVQEKAP